MITALAGAILAFGAPENSRLPVVGWTHDEVVGALERASFADITDSTADPAFPSIEAIVTDGVTVSVVRQVCGSQIPQPEERCAVASISFVISVDGPEQAMAARDALESSPIATPGANLVVISNPDQNGETRSALLVSHYLASDGGVAISALDSQIAAMQAVVSDAQAILAVTDLGQID
ncbi:MAG: hypothetical protein RIA71_12075 [Oceanicaulis sp.]